ncbi:MAG: deoxyhypusine synthase [Candidatus Altiarchaeales archaeon]|nr:MAG: deoxyhypusine synthase [Candidatus Altiarchaeales archaeon]
MKTVRDICIKRVGSIDEIVKQLFDGGGFTAKKFSQGVEILEMMQREECTKFLSFPACIIATGVRGVIRDLIKEKLFDVIITTTGTLDHDLARIWRNYYHGDFFMDDGELHKKKINRLGNILIPNESYGIILEKKLQPMFERIYMEEKEIPGYELIWRIGELLRNEDNAEKSITYWAWKNRIPIFIPGFFDGAFGSQLWMFWQMHKDLRVDLLRDQERLSDIVFGAEKSGALIIGGGISKHHTLWWNQFRDGLDYGVYITTAQEYDGSLSGARLREAISWGKLKKSARKVTIDGDATLILPLMIWALFERLKK